ncbi:MAG: hypothetical protein LBN10_02365 [Propionibacteriaceae bacterium]|jgi:hypothetical protein|nr:hypothetical protein [Propionibacteriaceae bacterium]
MPRTHDMLNTWVSAHAALLIEGQSRLAEVIGSESPDWEINLSAGLITLNGHRLQFALLGSVTEEDNSWLWSWADSGLDPRAIAITRARPLKEFGQEAGLWEFQEPSFDVTGILDLGLTPAASLALVGSPQIMGGAIFSAPYPGGRLYVAITDSQLTDEQPTAVTAVKYLTAARGYVPAAHRNIVNVYAAAHDLDVVEEPDLVSLGFEDGSQLEIYFDEDGCIVRMHGILPGTMSVHTPDEDAEEVTQSSPSEELEAVEDSSESEAAEEETEPSQAEEPEEVTESSQAEEPDEATEPSQAEETEEVTESSPSEGSEEVQEPDTPAALPVSDAADD